MKEHDGLRTSAMRVLVTVALMTLNSIWELKDSMRIESWMTDDLQMCCFCFESDVLWWFTVTCFSSLSMHRVRCPSSEPIARFNYNCAWQVLYTSNWLCLYSANIKTAQWMWCYWKRSWMTLDGNTRRAKMESWHKSKNKRGMMEGRMKLNKSQKDSLWLTELSLEGKKNRVTSVHAACRQVWNQWQV